MKNFILPIIFITGCSSTATTLSDDRVERDFNEAGASSEFVETGGGVPLPDIGGTPGLPGPTGGFVNSGAVANTGGFVNSGAVANTGGVTASGGATDGPTGESGGAVSVGGFVNTGGTVIPGVTGGSPTGECVPTINPCNRSNISGQKHCGQMVDECGNVVECPRCQSGTMCGKFIAEDGAQGFMVLDGDPNICYDKCGFRFFGYGLNFECEREAMEPQNPERSFIAEGVCLDYRITRLLNCEEGIDKCLSSTPLGEFTLYCLEVTEEVRRQTDPNFTIESVYLPVAEKY